MARKRTEDFTKTEEPGKEAGVLEVRAVEHPGAEATDEFHRDQAQKLLDYKVTGRNQGYIDQSRDQEPDIAPEFGVQPHPELFNPPAPLGTKSNDPRVTPFEEKQEAAKDAEDSGITAEAQAHAESFSVTPTTAALPVSVVEDKTEEK